MASGIQIFNVTITNGSAGAAPADGFIDSKKIENYAESLATTPSGLTLDLCMAKRRGNLRYTQIINQLQQMANCHIMSITAAGADAAIEPTSFSFQLWTEQGGVLITEDENNPGTFLTDAAAIIRCIARALTAHLFRQTDVVDPTSTLSVGIGASVSVPRHGVRVLPDSANPVLEVAPYAADLATAESFISVTPMF